MKIRRGSYLRQLPSKVHEILSIHVSVKKLRYPVSVLRLTDLPSPGEVGRPRYAALDDGRRLHLRPIPDKDYSMKIVYTKVEEM